MAITPIDLADDALMSRTYAVVSAVRVFERPHVVSSPEASAIGDLRHVDEGESTHLWGIWEGDALVGVITAWLPLSDNTDTVWMELDVHPGHRRRGHGTRAIETIVGFARANDRTRIVTEAHYPVDRADDHPYRLFAEHNGFRLGNTEMIRRLTLPVDPHLLARLGDGARAAYQGRYRVEAFTEVPRALWPSLCECMNRVGTDAPTGEIDWEPETLTPERYGGYMELDRATGRVRLTAVAIDEASGEVVAFSELALPPTITRAQQWGTLVRADHRGHRLGMAVKVANLVALQELYPERVDVTTGNANDNEWMVSINEELGFRPLELCPAFYRTLDPV